MDKNIPLYRKLVEYYISSYREYVKPAIDDGNFEFARVFIGEANTRIRISGQRDKIILFVKCGFNLLDQGNVLEERLRVKDVEGIIRSQKLFEVYASQTKLPVSDLRSISFLFDNSRIV